MFKFARSIGAAAIGLLCLSATLPAAAAEGSFAGRVDHVSTNNLKVTSDKGQTLSFELLPHFDQVFEQNGKTTYQMKKIRKGMWVNVYYDQHFLGMRHADKILMWHHSHYAGKMGS
jgi:hypothetical protein